MKKVLLVEDDSFLSNIYFIKLKEAGIVVDTAFSGEEAIIKIREQKPDLVLLDIILPGITGWEVLEKIRQDDDLRDIKVIVLSNIDEEKETNKGSKLGVAKHLVKAHHTPSEIVKEVRDLLNN